MCAVKTSGTRKLRGLKNISWLTARQLDQLYSALTVSVIEKRAIIFDEKHSPDSAYILLAVSRESPAAIAKASGRW